MVHNKPHTEYSKRKISESKKGQPLLQKRKTPIIKDGNVFWLCPNCNRLLPESSFYKSKRTWNKITSECRNCHIKCSIKTRDKTNTNILKRESARRKRASNIDKCRARERLAAKRRLKDIRYYARQMVNCALKIGLIIKPTICEQCLQVKKLTAHHNDYMKPLEVKWLCYECHGNK